MTVTAEQNSEANLLYTDTETALRSSVRALLERRCVPADVASVYDAGPQDFTPLWHTLAADMGLAGLLVPEALGGAGAGPREAAVVLEELGRAVAPVPFLTSAVLATLALRGAGDTDLLPALASGESTAALVVSLSTPSFTAPAGVRVVDGALTGAVRSVAGAAQADVLVVPAAGPDGLELHRVARDAPGVTVDPVLALDMTRPIADVRLDTRESVRVGSGGADAAVHDALRTAAALLASEQFGVAQWCFDTTLGYLKERRQFGRVLGSYQALKHRLADLWLDVGAAGAAARSAADACDRDDDADTATAVAQAYCSPLAVRAAEECIQLHGGIGMTWEYPAHLYLKRAKSSQLAFGTEYAYRARLGELVDLPSA
ncbi:acyl-CoA dehydrogenase family protein [Rhodococcus sp. HNM0569]|uniref:acyl-CoA dehydrogenase family protein n=1 Tax=Rhodococcus sp. HNM0569 TaxID=2716340 RepID=UPI00146B2663|nr:acyl-CoA dehydrogenase family protein [Rhodococcus sp. HNM0569]NLU85163.1 acyl-CoA/acyl-ACP dehydrogenase [Rhodococcus sp. HNM0569]